ncbi:hypothetical protein FSP39_012982 [Pinctada imbricata]|uniref:Uncharacterized protein n=1 Tax=Pinctada imbricata TaxID=66713 RepID=A0AA88XWA6_PINIB|nr:hypothetical protein FSP39_012982 [Pinctada imbricata]
MHVCPISGVAREKLSVCFYDTGIRPTASWGINFQYFDKNSMKANALIPDSGSSSLVKSNLNSERSFVYKDFKNRRTLDTDNTSDRGLLATSAPKVNVRQRIERIVRIRGDGDVFTYRGYTTPSPMEEQRTLAPKWPPPNMSAVWPTLAPVWPFYTQHTRNRLPPIRIKSGVPLSENILPPSLLESRSTDTSSVRNVISIDGADRAQQVTTNIPFTTERSMPESTGDPAQVSWLDTVRLSSSAKTSMVGPGGGLAVPFFDGQASSKTSGSTERKTISFSGSVLNQGQRATNMDKILQGSVDSNANTQVTDDINLTISSGTKSSSTNIGSESTIITGNTDSMGSSFQTNLVNNTVITSKVSGGFTSGQQQNEPNLMIAGVTSYTDTDTASNIQSENSAIQTDDTNITTLDGANTSNTLIIGSSDRNVQSNNDGLDIISDSNLVVGGNRGQNTVSTINLSTVDNAVSLSNEGTSLDVSSSSIGTKESVFSGTNEDVTRSGSSASSTLVKDTSSLSTQSDSINTASSTQNIPRREGGSFVFSLKDKNKKTTSFTMPESKDINIATVTSDNSLGTSDFGSNKTLSTVKKTQVQTVYGPGVKTVTTITIINETRIIRMDGNGETGTSISKSQSSIDTSSANSLNKILTTVSGMGTQQTDSKASVSLVDGSSSNIIDSHGDTKLRSGMSVTQENFGSSGILSQVRHNVDVGGNTGGTLISTSNIDSTVDRRNQGIQTENVDLNINTDTATSTDTKSMDASIITGDSSSVSTSAKIDTNTGSTASGSSQVLVLMSNTTDRGTDSQMDVLVTGNTDRTTSDASISSDSSSIIRTSNIDSGSTLITEGSRTESTGQVDSTSTMAGTTGQNTVLISSKDKERKVVTDDVTIDANDGGRVILDGTENLIRDRTSNTATVIDDTQTVDRKVNIGVDDPSSSLTRSSMTINIFGTRPGQSRGNLVKMYFGDDASRAGIIRTSSSTDRQATSDNVQTVRVEAIQRPVVSNTQTVGQTGSNTQTYILRNVKEEGVDLPPPPPFKVATDDESNRDTSIFTERRVFTVDPSIRVQGSTSQDVRSKVIISLMDMGDRNRSFSITPVDKSQTVGSAVNIAKIGTGGSTDTSITIAAAGNENLDNQRSKVVITKFADAIQSIPMLTDRTRLAIGTSGDSVTFNGTSRTRGIQSTTTDVQSINTIQTSSRDAVPSSVVTIIDSTRTQADNTTDVDTTVPSNVEVIVEDVTLDSNITSDANYTTSNETIDSTTVSVDTSTASSLDVTSTLDYMNITTVTEGSTTDIYSTTEDTLNVTDSSAMSTTEGSLDNVTTDILNVTESYSNDILSTMEPVTTVSPIENNQTSFLDGNAVVIDNSRITNTDATVISTQATDLNNNGDIVVAPSVSVGANGGVVGVKDPLKNGGFISIRGESSITNDSSADNITLIPTDESRSSSITFIRGVDDRQIINTTRITSVSSSQPQTKTVTITKIQTTNNDQNINNPFGLNSGVVSLFGSKTQSSSDGAMTSSMQTGGSKIDTFLTLVNQTSLDGPQSISDGLQATATGVGVARNIVELVTSASNGSDSESQNIVDKDAFITRETSFTLDSTGSVKEDASSTLVQDSVKSDQGSQTSGGQSNLFNVIVIKPDQILDRPKVITTKTTETRTFITSDGKASTPEGGSSIALEGNTNIVDQSGGSVTRTRTITTQTRTSGTDTGSKIVFQGDRNIADQSRGGTSQMGSSGITRTVLINTVSGDNTNDAQTLPTGQSSISSQTVNNQQNVRFVQSNTGSQTSNQNNIVENGGTTTNVTRITIIRTGQPQTVRRTQVGQSNTVVRLNTAGTVKSGTLSTASSSGTNQGVRVLSEDDRATLPAVQDTTKQMVNRVLISSSGGSQQPIQQNVLTGSVSNQTQTESIAILRGNQQGMAPSGADGRVTSVETQQTGTAGMVTGNIQNQPNYRRFLILRTNPQGVLTSQQNANTNVINNQNNVRKVTIIRSNQMVPETVQTSGTLLSQGMQSGLGTVVSQNLPGQVSTSTQNITRFVTVTRQGQENQPNTIPSGNVNNQTNIRRFTIIRTNQNNPQTTLNLGSSNIQNLQNLQSGFGTVRTQTFTNQQTGTGGQQGIGTNRVVTVTSGQNQQVLPTGTLNAQGNVRQVTILRSNQEVPTVNIATTNSQNVQSIPTQRVISGNTDTGSSNLRRFIILRNGQNIDNSNLQNRLVSFTSDGENSVQTSGLSGTIGGQSNLGRLLLLRTNQQGGSTSQNINTNTTRFVTLTSQQQNNIPVSSAANTENRSTLRKITIVGTNTVVPKTVTNSTVKVTSENGVLSGTDNVGTLVKSGTKAPQFFVSVNSGNRGSVGLSGMDTMDPRLLAMSNNQGSGIMSGMNIGKFDMVAGPAFIGVNRASNQNVTGDLSKSTTIETKQFVMNSPGTNKKVMSNVNTVSLGPVQLTKILNGTRFNNNKTLSERLIDRVNGSDFGDTLIVKADDVYFVEKMSPNQNVKKLQTNSQPVTSDEVLRLESVIKKYLLNPKKTLENAKIIRQPRAVPENKVVAELNHMLDFLTKYFDKNKGIKNKAFIEIASTASAMDSPAKKSKQAEKLKMVIAELMSTLPPQLAKDKNSSSNVTNDVTSATETIETTTTTGAPKTTTIKTTTPKIRIPKLQNSIFRFKVYPFRKSGSISKSTATKSQNDTSGTEDSVLPENTQTNPTEQPEAVQTTTELPILTTTEMITSTAQAIGGNTGTLTSTGSGFVSSLGLGIQDQTITGLQLGSNIGSMGSMGNMGNMGNMGTPQSNGNPWQSMMAPQQPQPQESGMQTMAKFLAGLTPQQKVQFQALLGGGSAPAPKPVTPAPTTTVPPTPAPVPNVPDFNALAMKIVAGLKSKNTPTPEQIQQMLALSGMMGGGSSGGGSGGMDPMAMMGKDYTTINNNNTAEKNKYFIITTLLKINTEKGSDQLYCQRAAFRTDISILEYGPPDMNSSSVALRPFCALGGMAGLGNMAGMAGLGGGMGALAGMGGMAGWAPWAGWAL